MAAMSAPAEKALSPAPVTTSARTPPSRRSSRIARASSRSVAVSSALWTFGRFSVIVPTPSPRTRRRFANGWDLAVLIGRRSPPRRPASVLRRPVEAMMRLDEAHRPRLRAHHHRVGDRPALYVPHALQVVPGRDPGGREHHRARGEVLECVPLPQLEDAELPQLPRFVL